MGKFLRFVEIQTKVASFIPFLTGTLLALYMGARMNYINMVLMLLALLCIDMATTGLNHYKDYRRDVIKKGYHYEVHNPLGQGAVTAKGAKIILAALIFTAILSGFILFLRTDYIVLILGIISFGIGITYSAGPLPVSRTALGELFSGVFMGGIIPFISYYIHFYSEKPVVFNYSDGTLTAAADFNILLPVILISLPLVFLIANIMLANNICDVKEDFQNKRYTIPVTIGVKNSLILFRVLVFLSVLSVIAGVISGILPVYLIITVLSIPLLTSQTGKFVQNPVKAETFVNAVKNFVLTGAFIIAGIIISIIVQS